MKYQERVMHEQVELKSKLDSLKKFIESNKFNEIKTIEQSRLLTQRNIMSEYNDILQTRIANF